MIEDMERYRPLLLTWWMGNGKALGEVEQRVWSRVAGSFASELQLFEEESDDSAAAAARDAVSALEHDLHTAVLEALVKRALDGDAAAVTWLEERGLLPELGELLRQRSTCEHGRW